MLIKKTFIVAETGVNHNGSLKLAIKLIDAAKKSKADAVKFQTFDTDSEISKNTKKANYQKKNTSKNKTLYEMTKSLELSEKSLEKIISYAKKKNILFFSSASDIPSIKLLRKKKQKIWKIASNLINDFPFLKYVGSFNQKVILSTGMSNLKEIADALKTLTKYGTAREKITVLQCNSEYPSPIEDVNLKTMLTFKKLFGVKFGLSDHSKSLIIPAAAVAMGATIIEKHLTLSNKLKGPDHKASLEPKEFKNMVENIREVEKSLGDPIKKPTASERKNIFLLRKSIVCREKIKKGEIIKENKLTTRRPALGINPMYWNKIIGTKAKRNFIKGERLEIAKNKKL